MKPAFDKRIVRDIDSENPEQDKLYSSLYNNRFGYEDKSRPHS